MDGKAPGETNADYAIDFNSANDCNPTKQRTRSWRWAFGRRSAAQVKCCRFSLAL